MPEAAEVAVAAAQLAHVSVGRILESLVVTHPRTARHPSASALPDLVGRRVTAVDRHGKWILVGLDGTPRRLGIHLRMSGQLLVRDPGAEREDRHVHAVASLGTRVGPPRPVMGAPGRPRRGRGGDAGPLEVWFRDPRTFGELRIIDGPAPVADDVLAPHVDGRVLAERARRRTVGVKAVLLDQARFLAGIGSYLADEVLHAVGIPPTRSAATLGPGDWDRILEVARSMVVASTAVGGVTLVDEGWVDLWERPGRHGGDLVIHGLDACGRCGAAARRAIVGGRSARWCPVCQPDSPRRRGRT